MSDSRAPPYPRPYTAGRPDRRVWRDGPTPARRAVFEDYPARYPEPARAVVHYRKGLGGVLVRAARRVGAGYDEINSECVVGVVRAAQKYDPAHPSGASFDSYAVHRAGSELHRFVTAMTARAAARPLSLDPEVRFGPGGRAKPLTEVLGPAASGRA